MNWILTLILLFTSFVNLSVAGEPQPTNAPKKVNRDWPFWRGPNRNGKVASQNIPRKWSETENVAWKIKIAGRGHSSPCVIQNYVFLSTADEKTKVETALAFDRKTGNTLWEKVLTKGKFDSPSQARRSWSNCSPASDGERVIFLSSGHSRILATAFDFKGNRLWKKTVGDFVSHHGYSASPTIYKDLVLIAADHKGGGYLAGLNRKTGDIVWKTPRPKEPSYVSPAIYPIHGKDQLVISGCDLLAGYDPQSGQELWSYKAVTTECVGTVVAYGDLIYASGGYPKHLTVCAEAKKGGKVLWTKPLRTYVPSMLIHEGHLYTVTDRGIAYCWDAKTGKEKWKGRLKGTFIASPVLIGDTIIVPNEQGTTFLFKATPKELKVETENQLGNQIFATPVVCGGQIFLRSTHEGPNGKQEYLYCLEKK